MFLIALGINQPVELVPLSLSKVRRASLAQDDTFKVVLMCFGCFKQKTAIKVKFRDSGCDIGGRIYLVILLYHVYTLLSTKFPS